MFNLFKNKKTTSYPAIVEEIHNEFNSAGEKLLQEANSLLQELNQKDIAKGERLAAVGFGKAKEAVTAVQAKLKLASTKEVADLAMYYNMNYPNNKFITEAQVKSICEKYGLIFGDTSMYKGFVPESKLKLIENFKLKGQDKIKLYLEITEYHNGDNVELPLSHLTDKDLTDFGIGYLSKRTDYCYITGGDRESLQGTKLFNDKIYDLFSHLKFVKATVVDQKLKIVAPQKDMEIPQGKQVVGYKIKDIPDPVVLQPVKGGYLIVCAWGDEASDEIVVNQQMN